MTSFRRIATGVVTLAFACVGQTYADAPTHNAGPASTLTRIETDPLLVQSVYARRRNVISNDAVDGAVGSNADWEAGRGAKWYIEEQRYGGELVGAGVATGNRAYIDDGLKVIDWGFAHMRADGSFGDTGDPFHSVSLFVECTARAVLLLKQYDPSGYSRQIESDSAKLGVAAHWLLNPSVRATGVGHDRPYTHRRWILAAGLAEVGALTGDSSLTDAARDFATDGLALQTVDGVNPEKGGADVSYQMVGVLEAERYYAVTHDKRVPPMVKRAIAWFMTKVSADGSVSTEGSTRVGLETGRSGRVKHVDASAVIHALVAASIQASDSTYRSTARKIAIKRGWLKN